MLDTERDVATPTGALSSLARRAHGTLLVFRALPRQRRIPFLRARDLQLRRDAAVRETVRFAAQRVPHYRELLRDAGIDARQIRGAHELDALPLLDKRDVQREPTRFRPEDRLAHALVLRTTGSTAMPLEVVHDRRSALANIAYGARERGVEASVAGALRFLAVDVRAPAGTGSRVQGFYARETLRPARLAGTRLEVGTPVEEVLAELDRLRPTIVRSYGTYLEVLFRTAVARELTFHRPRAVLYSGDTMSAAGRELIEELGIRVLSRYNAVECFKIAYTCEEGAGFHVHEDLCHVRLVDGNGRDVEPGERGEVVISNLVNRGTVLLNYRLGDVARLDETRCACGRSSARLVELEGRVDDVIALSDGRFVYPTEVWQALRSHTNLLRYQLVQLAPAAFELRVVTTAEENAGAEAAAGDLSRLLGHARVTLVRVAELSAGPGGKFRHVVPLPPVRSNPPDSG